MLFTVLVGIVCLSAGIGVGRVKNKAKLDAIRSAVVEFEILSETDVNKVLAGIKSRL